MPEGHVIHRLAASYHDYFGGQVVWVSSPQGRFSDSAHRLNETRFIGAEAYGKQLFLEFDGKNWVRIHLGLYGKVTFGDAPEPSPVGQIRLRIFNEKHYADLRGPTVCELITPVEKSVVVGRLGPDPLREDADPDKAWERISTSKTSIATLLMDQKVISGVGNIYRAELLFRQGIDPKRAGRDLERAQWDAIWSDLVTLMVDGVMNGRIDTVYPQHMPEAMGRPPRVDDHGGEVYVYRRSGQVCYICAGTISLTTVNGRNLFWCSGCQQR